MGDADGRGSLVDVLAPRPAGAEGVYLQILGVDVHVHLFRLGQDSHGGGGGVDAALGLCFGHALHPVDAAFVLQPGVGPLPIDEEADLLKAPQLCLVEGDNLGLPALALGVGGVHPVEVVGEQGSLLPTGAAADFHNDVLPVVGVLGQQEQLQLLLQAGELYPLLPDLLLGHLLQLPVGGLLQQLLGAGEVLPALTPGPVGLHNGLNLLVLFHQPGIELPVRGGGGVVQFKIQLLIAAFEHL